MSNTDTPEIKMNIEDLYREDIFTDQKVGSIRRMSPITAEGDIDKARSVLYFGATQMMTPAGPLPLNFEIQGSNLTEVVNNFGDAANKSLEETMTELQEMRRQQASQIVMPGEPSSQIQMS
ncbi:MAG: hypothetical protein ACI9T9_000941 [Oleiphilaceae bacterium]|jgi:hypothetical protein